MDDNDELIAKIEEYDLYDNGIISSICEFHEEAGFITDKQAYVLVGVVEEHEEEEGITNNN